MLKKKNLKKGFSRTHILTLKSRVVSGTPEKFVSLSQLQRKPEKLTQTQLPALEMHKVG